MSFDIGPARSESGQKWTYVIITSALASPLAQRDLCTDVYLHSPYPMVSACECTKMNRHVSRGETGRGWPNTRSLRCEMRERKRAPFLSDLESCIFWFHQGKVDKVRITIELDVVVLKHAIYDEIIDL